MFMAKIFQNAKSFPGKKETFDPVLKKKPPKVKTL